MTHKINQCIHTMHARKSCFRLDYMHISMALYWPVLQRSY